MTENAMLVATEHPDYQKNKAGWKRNRDAISGQEAIKAGRELYLPKPNPADKTKENSARYENYLERALWYAAPERTQNSLVGFVFRKGPEKQVLVPQIEYISEDADGAGVSLEQLCKEVVGELLAVGRVGMLVDFPAPRGEGIPTAEDDMTNARHAHISIYPTESIINWKEEKRGAEMVKTLIVLAEMKDVSKNRFEHKLEQCYRVLSLDDGGYVQEVLDGKGNVIEGPFHPVNAEGNRWQIIPMEIAGAKTNRLEVDKAPMTHLCNHAVAFWQTSADHRENLHIHGQLTLGVTSSMDGKEWEECNPSGVLVGSHVGIFLGKTGGFHTATVPESSSLSEALKDLRAEMSELGAQIITKGGQAETAEAARIDAASESSVLTNVVGNASEAVEQALEWSAMFMGGNPDAIEFKLNSEFFDETLDPQTRTVMIAEMDRGLTAKTDVRAVLRKANVIDPLRKDEDIDAEVEASGLMLGMIGANDDDQDDEE